MPYEVIFQKMTCQGKASYAWGFPVIENAQDVSGLSLQVFFCGKNP